MDPTRKADPSLSRHVDAIWGGRENTQALLGAGRAVERLAESEGVKAVRAVLAREIETIDDRLDREPLGQASEYAHFHGRRGALRAFDEAVVAIEQRSEQRRARADAEAQSRDASGESEAER